MKRFLLDTNAAGHCMNKRHGFRERMAQEIRLGNKVGICIPVLGELWFGVERSKSSERNALFLRRTLPDWTVWPYDQKAAEEYGRLSALLKAAGRPMQQIDVQIAAIALPLGKTTVVSSDSDLRAVPGLDVEDWTN